MGSAHVGNMAAGAGALRQTALDRPQVNSAFAQLYQGNSKLAQLYQESQETRQEVMNAMDKEMTAANGGAALPNGFPQDAARLARLMRNDGNVQLVFMDLGGWDTHVNQGAAQGQLANRLQPLGQGLANLAQGLGDLFDDTTIVVMSEFGRTARQNGTNGTDHGHGNVMWLLGGRVNGGRVAGDWQGLDAAHLHEQRDLPVTTDFRAVLSQVAERHLQLSDAQLNKVFPDMGQINSHLQLIV
jgi:uncharacterized protein (DUF1501 family)